MQEGVEKFRSISAAAQDALIMMDSNEFISFWNEAAERILSYQKQEVIGKELYQIVALERFREPFHEAFGRFRNCRKT